MSIKHSKIYKIKRECIRIQIYQLNVIILESKFNGENIVKTINILL